MGKVYTQGSGSAANVARAKASIAANQPSTPDFMKPVNIPKPCAVKPTTVPVKR